MSANVFGNPINGEIYTKKARRDMAYNSRNEASKADKAHQYVEGLKNKWGTTGVEVSTRCLVYNATGDTLTFFGSHDYHGHLGPEGQYPILIENGQWGGFLHVKTSDNDTGSSAAVVYRGKNEAGVVCDWMFAWYNPMNTWNNKVYTEIREVDHFAKVDWNWISRLMDESGLNKTDTWGGCQSFVLTASGNSPTVEAIFTLPNA